MVLEGECYGQNYKMNPGQSLSRMIAICFFVLTKHLVDMPKLKESLLTKACQ